MEGLELRRLLAVQPFPLPLHRIDPPGSLAFQAEVTGLLSAADPVQGYTIALDAQQRLSVVASPGAALSSRITVLDPASVPMASLSGSAGDPVTLRNLAVSTAGVYTVQVEGTGGTLGDFDLQLLVNAAPEGESAGGPANNTRATAEAVAGGLTQLTPQVSRTTLLGKLNAGQGDGQDWYRINLADHQGLSVMADATAGSPVALRLYNAQGTLVAQGFAAANVDALINGFTDGTSNGQADEYFVQVTGGPGEYTLTVVLGASIDAEINNPADAAQRLGTAGRAVGTLGDLVGFAQVVGQSITSSDGITSDQFGYSVAISGSWAIVGSPEDEGESATNVGSAYLYHFDGSQWNEFQRIVPSDGSGLDNFGFSVAISGTTAFVGSRFGDAPGQADVGAVYVFSYNGTEWVETGKLVASDPGIGERFGNALAVDGNRLVVAAPLDRGAASDAGAVYVFERSGTKWVQTRKLAATDAASGDQFGTDVDISGDWIVVSAQFDDDVAGNAGSAYFFQFDGTNWIQRTKVTASDGQANDEFGRAVAISGNFAVVGAPEEDSAGIGAGKVYVFTLAEGQWTETDQILAEGTRVGDDIGSALDLEGTNLVIGARFAEGGGVNTGVTYLFRHDGEQWVEEERLELEAPSGEDLFGHAVAISDRFFIAGAPLSVPDELPSGSAMIFHILPETDYFRVPVRAGDSLVLATRTPLDPQNEPPNSLDPSITLYDPSGVQVASDDDGAPGDGHNASLSHVAAQSGWYLVVLSAESNTSGDYVLEVSGFTGPASFGVTATDPPPGAHLDVAPRQMRVELSDGVLVDSVAASDLRIGGVPATSVTVVDGRTLLFTLPSLVDGTYPVTIQAGALSSVQRQPLDAYSANFVVDTVAPRVVDSSHLDGDIIPVGSLQYSATFDEPLRADQIDTDDVALTGVLTGSHEPTSLAYDPATRTLTLVYDDLPEDNYRLTLRSGSGHLEDLAGNDLDGEPNPDGTIPSGDGLQGGDFSFEFGTDDGETAWPQPLVRVEPLGSLIYESHIDRVIGFADDVDTFTIDLDAGQVLTLEVEPGSGLQPTVELVAPGGTSRGTAVAPGAGERALLQTVPIDQAGTYTIRVASAGGSEGTYHFRLLLNAGLEQELPGAETDNDRSGAEDISGTFIPLPGVSSRGGVVGSLPPLLGERLVEDDFESQVIATPPWTIHSSDGQGRIRLTDETTAADGEFAMIMDRQPGGPFTLNEAILTVDLSQTDEAILSFWQADFGDEEHPLPDSFTGSVNGDGVAISSDGVTWHTIVNATNLKYGVWQREVVDLADAAAQAGIPLTANFQIKFQQYDNFELGLDGRGYDAIVVAIPDHGEDWYSVPLEAQQYVALAVSTLQDSVQVRLFDSSGQELAAGRPTANFDRYIPALQVAAAGNYYIQVTGNDGPYQLLVARGAELDAEINSELDSAQRLGAPFNILGFLHGEPPVGKIDFAPPEAASGLSGDKPSDPGKGATGPALLPAGMAEVDYRAQDVAAGNRVIVRYDESIEGEFPLVASLRGAKLAQQFSHSNLAVLDLDPEVNLGLALAQWGSLDGVLYAEPDYQLTVDETFPNDPRFGQQWGLHNSGQTGGTVDADVDAPETWDLITGSQEVVIAHIDSGIEYTHPDLAPNMWQNPAERDGQPGVDDDGNGYIDDIYGIDTFASDSDPMDDYGHGTHTAGILGAATNNGVGIAGTAWNVKIMALKFLGAAGVGTASGAIEAIEYMTRMKTEFGVNIVASNNSWGGGGFSQALLDAIQASIDAGILFVAAAGNSGLDADQVPHYPAAYDLDGIVSVTASDHNDQLGLFANIGAASVDLAAPGVGIWSTYLDGDYAQIDGTSMAAPFVTGAAALLFAAKPNATWAEVKDALLEGTDPIPSMQGFTLTGGRLNISRSLSILGDPGDYYKFDVSVGDDLRIETFTPGDAPLEFTNTVDLVLELYDDQGQLVHRAQGPGNEVLRYTTTTDGTYTLRVASQNGDGEYFVRVERASGLGPFEVVGITPGDGAVLGEAPTTVTVQFDDFVQAASVQPDDLTIDGVPATGVTQIQGRTVTFAVSPVGGGQHTIRLEEGSILDEEQTPLSAFQSTFTVDQTPPTVTVNSLTTNDSSPEITGTVDDPRATVLVMVAGNSYQATNNRDGTWVLLDDAIAPLEDGTYDVRVEATDPVGNVGRDATTGELTIDATAPQVAIDSLVTSDPAPRLTGTVDDPLAELQLTLNGLTYSPTNLGDGRWELAQGAVQSLPDGTYDILLTATDPLGNVGTDGTAGELTVDTVAPKVTVDRLVISDSRPPLSGTVDDPGATVRVKVAGKTYTATVQAGRWLLPDNVITPELGEGTYDVVARATDAAGNEGVDGTTNELTIDTTPPAVTVAVQQSANTSPRLFGQVDDPQAVVEVTVGGHTYTAVNLQDGNWELPEGTISPQLAEGTYDVEVAARDAAGNVGADGTQDELTIDTTPPTVTVDPLATTNRHPRITGTVDDPLVTVQVTIGTRTYAAVVHPDLTWEVDRVGNPLLNGVYDVIAVARDAAGNVGTDKTTNELRIDTIDPTVTVLAISTGDSTPTLTGTVSELDVTVQVTVAGQILTADVHPNGSWVVSGDQLSPLADGTYDVQVQATDLAGNVGKDNTHDELHIEQGTPIVTVDPLATSDSRPALEGTISDPEAEVVVQIGAQSHTAIHSGDGRWSLPDNTLSELADGLYDVVVRATSLDGKVGTDSSVNELLIDTTPPTVGVAGLATDDPSPALSGPIDDPSAEVSVTIDGQTYTAVNGGLGQWLIEAGVIGPLADGTYDVQVSATDGVGNTGHDTTQDELTIDTTPPQVTILPARANQASPELVGTVDDPAATLQLTVSGKTYPATNNGDGTWTLPAGTINPPLADGTYDVRLVAVDPLGNQGEDTTSDELLVDTVSPIITVDVLITADSTPALTGTVDDPTAEIEIKIHGKVWPATNRGDGTWLLADNTISPPLADKVYDVRAVARDAVGNTGSDDTTNELRVDTTAPVVTVQTLATNDSTPALEGTVDDASAVIEVRVEGTTYTATNRGDGTWVLPDGTITPPLADGTYDVQVSATDEAGNRGTDATSGELLVDQKAPVVTIDALATSNPRPALSGTVDDPLASVKVTVGGQTLQAQNLGNGRWQLGEGRINPALADGRYDVVVTATDAVGNKGSDSTLDELVIDQVAPQVTVDAVASNQGSPQLTGGLVDPASAIQDDTGGGAKRDWATLTAGARIVPDGREGTGAELPGGAGVVTVADSPDLNLSPVRRRTISLWFNLDTLPASGERMVLFEEGDGFTGLNLYVEDGQLKAGGYRSGDGGWSTFLASGPGSLETDVWYHAALVIDAPEVGDGTLTAYLDGTAFGSGLGRRISAHASVGIGGVLGSTRVGSSEQPLGSGHGLDGRLDELRIVNRALAPEQIQQLAQGDALSLPDTVALWTFDPPKTQVQVTVDGKAYQAFNHGDGTWSLLAGTISPDLDPGTYEVEAVATDAAGNSGSDSTHTELVIDVTAPTITVDRISTGDSTPPLFGNVDDPQAMIEITVAGKTYTAENLGTGRWQLGDNVLSPPLADGVYDVVAVARDRAGNSGQDTTTDELRIDAVAPAVSVTFLVTNIPSPSLSGTVDDLQATIQLRVGGQTVTATNNGDGTWTLPAGTLQPLSDGTYDVAVTASDAQGNTGQDSTIDELTIDTVAPQVTVTRLLTNDNTPALDGSVSEPLAVVKVTVDGTTYEATNRGDGTWFVANDVIGPLAEGTYDVEVQATDAAGNAGSDPGQGALILDRTPPVATFDRITTGVRSPELTGTIDDPDATIDVTVDSHTYRADNRGDGTWVLPAGEIDPPLADGAYTVQLQVTDLAGNTRRFQFSRQLVIDNSAAIPKVFSLTTRETRPALAGAIDDPDVTIEVTVAGTTYEAFNQGDGFWSLPADVIGPLDEGTYEVVVIATDGTGNQGMDLTVDELTIDRAAPTATVEFLQTRSAFPELTGTISDSDAMIEVEVDGKVFRGENAGDGTWHLLPGTVPLEPGTYAVTLLVTDPAGNETVVTEPDVLVILPDGPPPEAVDALFAEDPSAGLDDAEFDLGDHLDSPGP